MTPGIQPHEVGGVQHSRPWHHRVTQPGWLWGPSPWLPWTWNFPAWRNFPTPSLWHWWHSTWGGTGPRWWGWGTRIPSRITPPHWATHFVGFRIPQQICERLGQLQARLLESQPVLDQAAVPLERSHVTLLVLRLLPQQLEKAEAALVKAKDTWLEKVGEEPQQFWIKGVGHFPNNGVLYAKAGSQDLLQTFHDELVLAFSDAGLPIVEDPSSTSPAQADVKVSVTFSPHVTLLKASQVARAGRKKACAIDAINSVAQHLLEQAEALDFGQGLIEVCELVDIQKMQADGYYDVVASVNLYDEVTRDEVVNLHRASSSSSAEAFTGILDGLVLPSAEPLPEELHEKSDEQMEASVVQETVQASIPCTEGVEPPQEQPSEQQQQQVAMAMQRRRPRRKQQQVGKVWRMQQQHQPWSQQPWSQQSRQSWLRQSRQPHRQMSQPEYMYRVKKEHKRFDRQMKLLTKHHLPGHEVTRPLTLDEAKRLLAVLYQ
eukprot:TRINITY_DN94157_c0_g1_i1.p1 TRINITY_DN94157_c0_g1~~TRINITY_DN94157_c0_g1_i1.p1  ORF type:complete len:524 (+),score=95.76 TRINITY_DN94157_c0_g1_i1:109-1572(+)